LYYLLNLIAGSSGGSVGVILTTLLSMAARVQWGARMSALVENMMTSVERILEYGKLDQEINLKSDPKAAVGTSDYERTGGIRLKNVWLRYAFDHPYVLKDLSCSIVPREKVSCDCYIVCVARKFTLLPDAPFIWSRNAENSPVVFCSLSYSQFC
jgi:ABC-type multidrug transport system fused ATPase/permease subunit